MNYERVLHAGIDNSTRILYFLIKGENMKNLRNLSRFILTMLTMMVCTSVLYANPATSGNPVTVNRNSGFNALRSPALMSWQEDDTSGIGYIYSLQVYEDIEGTINNGIEIPVYADSKSIFKGTGLFSCVLRSGDHSFGIGIRNTDEAQFALSESSQEFTLGMYSMHNEEKKKIINLSSVLSYSYRIGSKHALGIQGETGYGVTTIDKTTEEFVSGAVTTSSNNTQTDSTSASLAAGYSFISKPFEAGIMIRGGEFSKVTINRSGENGGMAINDVETGPDYFQNKGFGITGGIAFRPDYRLLVNMEAGIDFPYKYGKKSINDSNNVVDDDVHSSGVYMFRTGADYRVNRNLSAGIGASYAFSSSSTDSSDGRSTEMNLNLFEFTSGIEYRFMNGIDLLVACNFLYISADMGMENPGMEIDLGFDTLSVNFVTGISTAF